MFMKAVKTDSKNKFGLTMRDMLTIKKIFEKYPQIKEVHIFGSRAKGNYTTGSDIDLAVMNSGVTDYCIRNIMSDFEESSLPYKVDLVKFTTIKHADFIDHIKRVGVLFYRKPEGAT
jgi:predicted nucleotidyltransferase